MVKATTGDISNINIINEKLDEALRIINIYRMLTGALAPDGGAHMPGPLKGSIQVKLNGVVLEIPPDAHYLTPGSFENSCREYLRGPIVTALQNFKQALAEEIRRFDIRV